MDRRSRERNKGAQAPVIQSGGPIGAELKPVAGVGGTWKHTGAGRNKGRQPWEGKRGKPARWLAGAMRMETRGV